MRRRAGLAVALAALGLFLQGCAGVAVQWRDTDRLDVVATAAKLREAAAREGVPTDGSPRRASGHERVVRRERGGLVEWTYRETDGQCVNLLVIFPVILPGCRELDRYVFEGARLVSASHRHYPHYGLVCSPFLMLLPRDASLCDAMWGGDS